MKASGKGDNKQEKDLGNTLTASGEQDLNSRIKESSS